jgi:ABC-type oligopeptide transport system substrate-binding subunit
MKATCAFLAFLLTGPAPLAAAAGQHAIAMHGQPKYGPDFTHFDYVRPDAPKGGLLRLARTGSFDSLQPFIVLGVPAANLELTYLSLMARSADEPFSLYPQIASGIETPPGREWVRFTLRPEARFHDGSPILADDVIFSLHTLRDRGRPNHRYYYGQVERVERHSAHSLTLHFIKGANRELALILGLMPIVAASDFADRPFDRPGLKPLNGSGPYQVEQVEAGRSILYRRLPGHWSERLPVFVGRNNFERIRYDYFRDDGVALEALLADAYDLREETDPKQWASAYGHQAVHEGRILKLELPHGRPAGMNAIAFNTRRPALRDRRVREALLLAFDFPWLNRTLFHDAYRRIESYFANSELAASGVAGEVERAMLADAGAADAALRQPPDPLGSGLDERGRLRLARERLAQAGWAVREGQLRDAAGQPLRLEVLLNRREDERWLLPYAEGLRRLGIELAPRTVDSAQFQARLTNFDYDAVIFQWQQSLSPGSEQAVYWGSAAAEQPGSRNYPGIREPAIDSLIERLVGAVERAELVAAARALDRVLLAGHYLLPLFYLPQDRVAAWDRFGRPDKPPLYGYRLDTWWEASERLSRLPRP